MFDLFSLTRRAKVRKYFMGAILVVVSASMLLYLVPNYDRYSGANSTVVARIGKDTISESEVRQLIQSETRGRQIPAEVIPNYVPQMIQQMITDRALAYQASKLGFQISNQELAGAIRQMYPSLFPDGKFVGQEIYAAMLAQQNLTTDEFEANLKQGMLINRLREVAVEGSVVTPREIEQQFRKDNEQIKIEYVKLTQDKYKKEAEPTPADMETYFKTNAARYTIPEKRNLALLIDDQSTLAQSLTPTDAELMADYNQNINNFRMPERVHARHILFMTQGKPAADDAKIKAQAEDVLKQLRAGADFATLAKKYSQDPGSASKGGDLGWVTRGQMVPEFEKVTFSLKPNQISDLVKTQYGYHIIQVLEHEQARVKPFAEVKDDLAKQWQTQQANNKLQQFSDTAQTDLQKDPDHPEKVAADLGAQYVRFDGYSAGSTIPALGPSPDLDQVVSGLKKGEVSQPVEVSNTKLVVAEVLDVIPSRPATFDEVKNQVHDAMVANRLMNLVQQHAKELADAAKANGGDLAKAAKAMGLEVKTSTPFKQHDNIDGFGPASYVTDAFSKPDGTVLNPIPMAEGTVVVKVVGHIAPDMSTFAAQRDSIRDQLKQDKARERESLFENGVLDELTRKGVVKINQDVIKRIVSSYTSNG